MKGESNNEQRAVVVNPEPECIRFLESYDMDIGFLYLDSWDRWKVRGPREYPTDWKNYDWTKDPLVKQIHVRDQFIGRYGYAILTRRAIEAMRPHAPLVEIGAGSGYWTYELRKWGIDCVATDPMTGKYGWVFKDWALTEETIERKPTRWQHHYVEIETINSVEAVRKYPNRNILTVWPDYDASWAADAVSMFTGQVVIYHGEGHGNATADDRFHELLDERFGDQEVIPMPHFESLYDRQLLICKQPKQLKGTS